MPCLLLCITCVLLALIFLLKKYDNPLINVTQIFTAVFCLCTPLFNRFGYYKVLRYCMVLALCFNNFISTSVLGFESLRPLLLTPVIISIFMLWQNESVFNLLAAFSIPMITILTMHMTDYSLFLDPEISKASIRQISKNNFLLAILSLCIVLFLYVLILHKKEESVRTAQDELNTIFLNSIDSFFLIDLKTHLILRCNPSAVKLFGASSESDLVGKKGSDFQKKTINEQQFAKLGSILTNGGVYAAEIEYKSLTGKEFWGDVVITLISKNKTGGTYLVRISDITEKKNMLLQREEFNRELVKHNQNLEQFSFITSHNLRAPVASMAGALSIYNRKEPTDPKNEMVIEMLNKSVSKLDAVIHDLNQLLTIKQFSNDKKTKVFFDELLDEVLTGLNSLINQHNISIEADFSKSPAIDTIRTYAYSILINLISNAIKYRAYDRPCEITIYTERKEGATRLIVVDNGIGIDLEKYGDKLFGLYKRFHNHVEGKGLGLHMVKVQAETLGAEILVDSKVNVGTIFTVVFKKS